MVNRERVGTETHLNLNRIIGSSASIIELLKYLPDLNSALKNSGVAVPSSRVDYEITLLKDQAVVGNFEWRIHGAGTNEDLLSILEKFVIPEDEKDKFTKNIIENNTSCIVKLAHKFGTPMSFPSYRETINNEKIIYATQQFDRHEIVDSYLAAYGLSMLSRYFPDIWVSCLESHCKAAQLIERFVFVLIKKAPIMTLATMRSDDFVISTHRPPWH